MHASVNGRCPEYISEILVATFALPGHSMLRSTYVVGSIRRPADKGRIRRRVEDVE